MREIKFRAWDIELGKYERDGVSIGTMYAAYNITRGNEEYIFEQYTGLHDKNGREIYEGDILHLPNNGPIGGRNRRVVWKDAGAIGWGVLSMCANKYVRCFMLNTNDIQEVIGNIHENPELVKSH